MVSTVQQDLTSDDSEFQVCGAVTEKDRHANSVCVLVMFSSGVSDDRRGRTRTAVKIWSLKYAGVEEDIVLNVSATILYVTRCLLLDWQPVERHEKWSGIGSILAGRGPWLGWSVLAAVHRKSQPVLSGLKHTLTY